MDFAQHNIDPVYMHRCIQLAIYGAGHVAPNPMVGAVLVHDNRVIGEGYHQKFGGPHAEVNCIRDAIDMGFESLIARSTLYVSLEPCSHTGKTPPCSDLVIAYKIPRVVIGVSDPYKEVSGRGISKLKEAGVEVFTGLLADTCMDLNKRFFHFHQNQHPYIILKWARTADGIMGNDDAERLFISGDVSNRLVHRWRSEEAAILVGTRTVLKDDPKLTARYWAGLNPIRLVVDLKNIIPADAQVFSEEATTIILNGEKNTLPGNIQRTSLDSKPYWWKIDTGKNISQNITGLCTQLNIQSVLVEGGAAMLGSFIQEGFWDEARIITNQQLFAVKGIPSPLLTGAVLVNQQRSGNDIISYFRPANKL